MNLQNPILNFEWTDALTSPKQYAPSTFPKLGQYKTLMFVHLPNKLPAIFTIVGSYCNHISIIKQSKHLQELLICVCPICKSVKGGWNQTTIISLDWLNRKRI